MRLLLCYDETRTAWGEKPEVFLIHSGERYLSKRVLEWIKNYPNHIYFYVDCEEI